MTIDEKKIDDELELWKRFFGNYENLAINVLVDVLAHYKEEDRQNLIDRANDVIKNVKQPITGEQMYDSIKGDLESFDSINEESKIAYRTLTWVKEIAENKKEDE